MERDLAISDVHGHFEALRSLIEDVVKFNPETDSIRVLGDVLDRGHRNREVIEYLLALKERHPKKVILHWGNHEDMAYRSLIQRDSQMRLMWLNNGGRMTIDSIGSEAKAKELLGQYFKHLVPYSRFDDIVFVHGCVPHQAFAKDCTIGELTWGRDWATKKGYKSKEQCQVVGHTLVTEPLITQTLIALDTGAVFTGKLTAFDILHCKVYQTDCKPLIDIPLRGWLFNEPMRVV